MTPTATIYLKKSKEASILRRHLWVFSGAISRIDGQPLEGDIVDVRSHDHQFLARGFYSSLGSISVRILSFEPVPIDFEFYHRTMLRAHQRRMHAIEDTTNIYRWVHGEADGIPSLIVDRYADHIVVQAHTLGVHKHRELIAEAIDAVWSPDTIYYKSHLTLNQKVENEFLKGSNTHVVAIENGRKYMIDWTTGQKTGFFIDQKDNRKRLNQLKGIGSVLNTFCYSGGFSVSVPSSVDHIVSVDSSKSAMELCKQNVALNGLESVHTAVCADVFEYLASDTQTYDMVILDPPAFAKHIGSRHQAIQAYKRLNIAGIKKVKPGGMMMTYSCSQVVDRELFEKTIYIASIESQRSISIIAYLGQSSDHPINIYHPEGSYLKGLLLHID